MPDHLLTPALCERLLAAALSRGGDDADVFAERTVSRTLRFEEGKVKSSAQHTRAGVGVRVVQGEKSGYAFCEDPDEKALIATAERAALIAAGARTGSAPLRELVGQPDRYRIAEPMAAVPMQERIALLRRASERALAAEPRISWVSCSLEDSESTVTIATSDGVLVTDRRPMLRVVVSVLARDGERRESSYAGGGGRLGLEYFRKRSPESLADEAAARVRTLLAAEDCPAGAMPVVLAPGWSGVLIHEAVGHGLEADFNRKGVSNYAGKVGEMVASPLVTVVDDGAVANDRGSINVDDEGAVPGATTLIERGRLVGYLNDRQSARLMGAARTGNGRRESYAHQPMPRMRVTYLAGGESDPGDIVRSVKRGLYVATVGGGSVDITKGDFNFAVDEAYLIEDGRIGRPVRGAALIGNGPEVLRKVTALGNDLQLADGIGTCGKNGQGCPVGLGMPTTLISEMLVGGSKAEGA